jgi:integrase
MKGMYQNKDKGMVWYVNGDIAGKRVHRSLRSKKKAEAEAKLLAMIAEMEGKIIITPPTPAITAPSSPNSMLLSEAVDKVYKERWHKLARPHEPLTKMKLIQELCGNTTIDAIGPEYIGLLREKLFARDIEGSTVNRYVSDLRVTLNDMLKAGKLRSVPFFPMSEENERVRYLTRDELQKLTAWMRECPYKAGGELGVRIIIFLLETGCRVTEALTSTWEVNLDVSDFTDDSAPISITFFRTKAKKVRTIPATTVLRNWLLHEWRDSERSGLLFPAPEFKSSGGKTEGKRSKRKQLHSDDFATAFAWCRKQMKLEGDHEFLAHALRHTCASRLVKQGTPLYDVMLWLGHSRFETVLRYAHADDDHLKPAAAALDRAQIAAHASAKKQLSAGQKVSLPKL